MRRLKGSFSTYSRRPKSARYFGDSGVQKVTGIPGNNKNGVEVIVVATGGEVYTFGKRAEGGVIIAYFLETKPFPG